AQREATRRRSICGATAACYPSNEHTWHSSGHIILRLASGSLLVAMQRNKNKLRWPHSATGPGQHRCRSRVPHCASLRKVALASVLPPRPPVTHRAVKLCVHCAAAASTDGCVDRGATNFFARTRVACVGDVGADQPP